MWREETLKRKRGFLDACETAPYFIRPLKGKQDIDRYSDRYGRFRVPRYSVQCSGHCTCSYGALVYVHHLLTLTSQCRRSTALHLAWRERTLTQYDNNCAPHYCNCNMPWADACSPLTALSFFLFPRYNRTATVSTGMQGMWDKAWAADIVDFKTKGQ